jgi:hypothetical protein
MARTSTSEVAFGVQYLPASVELPTLGGGNVLLELEKNGIRYIRFQWVDFTNITRYRNIPFSAFCKLLSAPRPGIGITKAVLGLIGPSIAPGFSATGEYLYTPDLSSTRLCGYSPGHASLMGWFEEKVPTQEHARNEDAFKSPLCPRWLLKGIVKYVDSEIVG